jgi:hypothetical protein
MAEKKDKKSHRSYQKPVFVKEKGLTFPKEIIEKFNGGRFCVQCAGCHGCK